MEHVDDDIAMILPTQMQMPLVEFGMQATKASIIEALLTPLVRLYDVLILTYLLHNMME